ncbi:MAG: YaiI/YqxD family protein [Deltaproteobacteria bacterium]|nr:YaiI/YqxD family protein [Deltaproteobacteria bacterium]MBT4268984.1 YaiI/YqxD family protein [Deltaproteobacteria bacterium]MBT4641621.1 YaiI/YqxD family protein [Deltaproteobacteria bacterium]MBT6500855.1 YaiI/YqxD family protein [Deltaproteobacteria bacterium]MBT6613562.1 YaiI/YqxD family protein [Deltaproteobacteria bacterium]
MNLFIDGDALPNVLKPILLRAIERLNLPTFIVSNRLVSIGRSKHITSLTVASGADEADHRIVEMVEEGDLVITADIPLADRVITKNAHAIDHRGKLYGIHNIKQSLAIRNLMQEIRDSGEVTKGPAPFSQKDAHEFANQLDHFLTKQRLD